MDLNGFYEDWDGEMVLSEVSRFKDESDFLEQAQKYFDYTRGYHVPVKKDSIEVLTVIVNEDEEWYSKKSAEKNGFEGRELTVYKVDFDYEKVNC